MCTLLKKRGGKGWKKIKKSQDKWGKTKKKKKKEIQAKEN